MKKLNHSFNTGVFLITNYTQQIYVNIKTEEEIREKSEYEEAFVVSDDKFDSNQKATSLFVTKVRHKDLDVD